MYQHSAATSTVILNKIIYFRRKSHGVENLAKISTEQKYMMKRSFSI